MMGNRSERKDVCSHIRIRDNNSYKFNIDKFIKRIEQDFKVDIRTVHEWKWLVKRLHVARTDRKRIIQDAYLRKLGIIEKLLIQNYRPSPFELTGKRYPIGVKEPAQLVEDLSKLLELQGEYEGEKSTQDEISNVISTPHPNTEITQSEGFEIKQDIIATGDDLEKLHELPPYISFIENKYISPLRSYEYLENIVVPPYDGQDFSKDVYLNEKCTDKLLCTPEAIFLYRVSPKKHTRKFVILNRFTEYLHIQFKNIIYDENIKFYKLEPATPVILHAGISATFTLNFQLYDDNTSFISYIRFRVSKDIVINPTKEIFRIPFVAEFKKRRLIRVPKTVNIPPIYIWQMNVQARHPSGLLNIIINDEFSYHLHIKKHDAIYLDDVSLDSIPVIPLCADIDIIEEQEEQELEIVIPVPAPSKRSSRTKTDDLIDDLMVEEDEETKVIREIYMILGEALDLALDVILLKNTYLKLPPHSSNAIPIYFIKSDHVGRYQCAYDLYFYDAETEDFVAKYTIIVYAEILPHPLEICPPFLDMTDSIVDVGQCKEIISMTNNHKIYAVTIKIVMTPRTQKLLCIKPMQVLIPPSSKVDFEVRLCSKQLLIEKKFWTEFVHFSLKIIMCGNEAVYDKCPPIFYEIIAPCAVDYKLICPDYELKKTSGEKTTDDPEPK